MSKLRRRAMRHFVMLAEIHVHLIRVNPGHICKIQEKIFYTFLALLSDIFLTTLQ